MTRPIRFRWQGDGFAPATAYQAKIADEEYVIGETYELVPIEERSGPSHRHQFAWLREAFNSLPEQYGMESWAQSPEALRKYALIRTGWADAHTYACATKAEAARLAAAIRPLDEFAIVVVKDDTVTRYTAKSQSGHAMKKADFEASKRAILEFIAGLIGVSPDDLGKQQAAA